MRGMHQQSQSIAQERRGFLRTGFLLLAGIVARSAFPSTCLAAQKLIFPMPKRPPLSRARRFHKPKVALIIDDMGNSMHLARAFLHIPLPITFSVLPFRPFSKAVLEEIVSRDHETLLHQPMEPFRRDIDPGPGAVYTSFSRTQIEDTIKKNLSQVAVARGVNNHMGSKFTATKAKYGTAKRLHIHAAHRNVFLDCEMSVEGTVRQMKRLITRALSHGRAIGIGHPFPSTLKGITKFLESYDTVMDQVQFVPVSALLYT
ncbi:MAG: divergent polysaccharide deacetylase family protein [Deltaproteobacteria bacterium]|nr:divergent polysaccharide deacetylase family protein [Deltaproteobacteria bacterium]